MKFGKWLKQQIRESFPEWRDEFLAYKDLKRSVKLISATPPELAMATRVEAYFIRLLYSEIDKFNAFFSEHEENFVIRQKELRERITTFQMGPTNDAWSEVEYREEMQEIRRDVVNLHGEMVLLVNYSCVNYTGLAKILKKYDKRTGRLLRLPFIKKVLEQPFFTTDIISNLVKECENTMDMVFPVSNEEWLATVGQGTAPLIIAEESIFRNTVAALVTMREMRRASSTNSPLSLPPLNLPENDLIHLVQLRSPMNNTI